MRNSRTRSGLARKRATETEREIREIERHTQRQIEIHTETETHRGRDTERDTETERDTQRQRFRQTQI